MYTPLGASASTGSLAPVREFLARVHLISETSLVMSRRRCRDCFGAAAAAGFARATSGGSTATSWLYLTDRSMKVINRGGEIVSPLEVEEVVLAHPAAIGPSASRSRCCTRCSARPSRSASCRAGPRLRHDADGGDEARAARASRPSLRTRSARTARRSIVVVVVVVIFVVHRRLAARRFRLRRRRHCRRLFVVIVSVVCHRRLSSLSSSSGAGGAHSAGAGVGADAAFASVVSEPPPLPDASGGRSAVATASRRQRRRDGHGGGDDGDDA